MLFDEDSRAERLRKVRKQRTVFESNQLDMLEDTFKNNPYPSSDEYETLAKRISIDEARLRIWFQNRRARYRRSSKNVPNSPVPVSHFSVPNFATRHPILPASPFSQSQLLMLGAHPLMFGGFWLSQNYDKYPVVKRMNAEWLNAQQTPNWATQDNSADEGQPRSRTVHKARPTFIANIWHYVHPLAQSITRAIEYIRNSNNPVHQQNTQLLLSTLYNHVSSHHLNC